jgi:hypothetical protein
VTDFVGGLRQDLVAAASRETARGRARRSRRVLERALPRPGALAGALALAALVAVLAATLVKVAPTRPAVAPHVVATLRFGGQPADAAIAGGFLWVTDFERRLVQIDPRAGKVVRRLRLGGTDSASITAGGGRLWLAVPGGARGAGGTTRVFARGAATGRPLWRTAEAYGTPLAVGAGGVWLASDPFSGAGYIERRDPATGAVTARVRLADASAMATAGDAVWVLAGDGTVSAVSAAGRRVTLRLPRLIDPVTYSLAHAIVAGRGEVWVDDPGAGSLVRVAGGRVTRRLHVGGVPGPMALARGMVWSTVSDARRFHYRLLRLSASTGRISGRLDLGGSQPSAVVPARDGVWVVFSDGSVLHVRG